MPKNIRKNKLKHAKKAQKYGRKRLQNQKNYTAVRTLGRTASSEVPSWWMLLNLPDWSVLLTKKTPVSENIIFC